ncbi:MAG: hypothetical protein II876_10590, partial [Synergistaceae bacterium]|nr:hypothetical protein [Synergistaceae bacterium]
IDIERLDKNSSYKGVLTATVNADAEVNVWDVTVKQLASAQINRSKQITGSSLSSILSGVSGNTMYVNAGGQKIGIEVKSSDTLDSLKSRINTTLKTLDSPIYVTASVVDNKLILKSDYTGLGTMTATETARYNYSSGINRLNNISIPEAAYDNVKVTSGTKSYVIHKDFEVANGNEIRWKQNDRGNDNQLEVGLNDEVNINYKMAAGDQYTAKGTCNNKEAEISGFELVNNGTIASRAKIVDDDGNEYFYGKDFEIKDKKIVWLEAPEVDDSPKYNEPDAYTVSLTKNIPVNITKTYAKATGTNEPDSYTVSYDKTVEGSYNVAGTKTSPVSIPDSYTVSYDKVLEARVSSSANVVDLNRTASGDIPTFVEFRDDYDIPVITWNTYKVLDFDSSSKDKIEIVENGSVSSYSCGTGTSGDFIMRKATYGTSNPENQPEWNNYVDIQWLSSNKPSSEYTVRHTHTYSASSNDSSGIEEVITAAGTDNITITGSDGTEYVQGTHFEIRGGKIVWKTQDEITDLTNEQFADLQAQYKEGTGSDLATKTLIDGDGVIRTYVDPEDPSLFNMSAGGKDYVYGRDYVLRVNDSGSGYRFDWLVDDSNTITDANTSVSTYAAYRNISTQTWQKAPADDTAYTFNFAGSHETTLTADVTSTQADKTLSGIFGETVTDTSKVSITDSNGNIRTDYTISGDTITWSGTTPSTDDAFDITTLQSAFLNTTGSSSIPRVTLTDSDGVLRTYLDLSDSEVNFQLADASGNAYTYGRDYVIRVSDDGQDYVISWAVTGDSNNDGTTDVKDFNPVVAAYASEKDINTSNWRTAPTSGNFTFTTTSTKTISLSGNVKATDTDKSLAHVLNSSSLTSADYSSISIPGYTQGKDYVIDSTGTIRWLNQNSTTPEAYKATYKFSDTASVTVSNISASGTSISVRMPSLTDMGVKTFVGDKLNGSTSYNYVDENEGKAAFTLTDSAGNTYEYGKDFAVRCSSLTSTSLQLVMPNNGYWPSSFSNTTRTIPANETLTLTYNNTVSRFVYSEDTLKDGLGFKPSDLSKLTITDAYGNEYTKDTDYEIDASRNVSWVEIEDLPAPNSYTASCTLVQVDITPDSSKSNYDSLLTASALTITTITNYGFPTVDIAIPNKIVRTIDALNPSAPDGYTFSIALKSSDGDYTVSSDYVYGRDYTVRKTDDASNTSRGLLVAFHNRAEVTNYKNHVTSNPSTYGTVDLSGTPHNRPSSDYRVSLVHKAESTDASSLSSLISEANGNYDKIILTGDNGRTYTYVSDVKDLGYTNFTIVDGEIMFRPSDTPKHPAEGVGYTFTYDAFSVEGTDTYSSANTTQEVSIAISDDAGNIGGNAVSYEQILSFASVSSTETDQDKIDSALGNLFSLTDSDGNSYTYGT